MSRCAKQAISSDDLRIVLLRDRSVTEDHAVLAARHDGHWLILDNRSAHMIEDRALSSVTPLFAINHQGVHLFATPYVKRLMDCPDPITAPLEQSLNSASPDIDSNVAIPALL